MKRIILSLLCVSFLNLYADDYVYFNYNTFSDDGGESIHRFFKVKVPSDVEYDLVCKLGFEYFEVGNKEEADSVYQVAIQREKDQSMIAIAYEESSPEGDDPSYSISMDFRGSLTELFVTSSHGDGYVSDELMAGSMSLINKAINYFEDEENPNKYPDGKIDQAFDLTNNNYSKVIEGEDDPDYKTILNVECEKNEE